jgi:hypothetical protein
MTTGVKAAAIAAALGGVRSIVLSKFDSMSLINTVQRKEINDE